MRFMFSKLNYRIGLFITIVIVGVVATALLITRPWNSPLTVQDLLERFTVLPSATGAYTYRINSTTTETVDGREITFIVDVSYASPDKVHYSSSTSNSTFEYVTIGDIRYQRETGKPSEPGNSTTILCTSDTSIETTFHELVTYLGDAERLPDEEVSGGSCYHIRGSYIPFSIQEHLERQGDEYTEEEIERIIEKIGGDDVVMVDFWLNCRSFSLKKVQMVSSLQSGSRTSTVITTYYDFGEPIDITAPLDTNQQLLPGWYIVD